MNQHLTLKLNTKGETRIFVSGVYFRQCKYLLLIIPTQHLTNFKELKSIDEVALNLDDSLESLDGRLNLIPPETEFWGHCSNLQVWCEHGYKTDLLHSNLAFPLLERLAEVGDLQAQKVFKAEIVRRYNSGVESVREYLRENQYLQKLSIEEFHSAICSEEYGVVDEILQQIEPKVLRSGINFKNGRIIQLNFSGYKLKYLPKSVQELKSLKILQMSYNLLNEIPEEIGNLQALKEVLLYNNKLTKLPESIGKVKSLEILNINNNSLTEIPKSIGDLEFLRVLEMHNNQLKSLPVEICNLLNLEDLRISKNFLETLPVSLMRLKNLQKLTLSKNKLSLIPRSLGRALNLKRLSLDKNRLTSLPKDLGNLEKLEFLDISFNPITKIPDSIFNLHNLKELWIIYTNLEPDSINEKHFYNESIRIIHNNKRYKKINLN